MSQRPAEDAGRAAGTTEKSWLKAVPTGTGVTVLALHLSPPVPSAPALVSALRELQRAHPILRARLKASSSTISISKDPYVLLETLDAKATSDIVAASAAEDSDSDVSPFRAILRRELNRNPWANKDTDGAVLFSTLYTLGAGSPTTPSAVLAVRVHTVAGDRTTVFTMARELLGMIRDGASKAPGSTVLPLSPCMEDLVPREHTKKTFWAHGKDMLGYSLKFTRCSMLPFDNVKSERSTDFLVMDLSLDETQKLLNACHKKGIKLYAALTAAALMATASAKGLASNKSEPFSVITFKDCRKRLSKPLTAQDFGFYHSAVPSIHTVSGGDTFWDLAKKSYAYFSDAISQNKDFTDMSDLNYLMVKSMQAPSLTPSGSMRSAVLSVFDEPLTYDSSDMFQGVAVEDYMQCFSIHGIGASIGLFDTIRDGRLSCAFVYPTPLHSRKHVREFMEKMKRTLVAGIAA